MSYMQDTKRESGVDAEYQQYGDSQGGTNHNNNLNTFNDDQRFDDKSLRNNNRRNNRGGYRGRSTRNSNNWREDKLNDEDYEQRPYYREAGGGRGYYSGNRQGDGQKYRGPFSQNRSGEPGERGEEDFKHQPRRGGRGRGRGRGRGGYHQDPQQPSNDVDAPRKVEESTEQYTHETQDWKEATLKGRDDEPPSNNGLYSERQKPLQREDRQEFRGRGERHGGGYRGEQGYQQRRYGRHAEDQGLRDSRPRGGDGPNVNNANSGRRDSREKMKAAESYDKTEVAEETGRQGTVGENPHEAREREASSVLEVLPPGFKRRTQRAPHLRRNCFDESEILELFEHHHRQKGISLENYDNIPVTIVPRDIMAVEDFSDLKVEPALMASIELCGYKKPTPVQRYGIPVAIAGNDLMACAQTGSGKTAAFLIPIVQSILVKGVSPAKKGICYPIGLIMAPTRELALQIYDEVRKLTFRTDIFYDVVYGGTPYPTRFESDILVACPGRLKDIFDRGSLSFQAIKFLVLDEADRMLEMGFEEQIEYLVASRYTDMPKVDERQTLMFSATFPNRILSLARRYLRKHYYLLTIGRVGSTTKNITQVIEKVQETEKMDRLFKLIYSHKKSDLVLIFVETKKAADDLHRELKKEHIPSSTIHGDRRQQDRERALAEFKSGETPILVATDVASRGLDIPNVAHVIQYDLPSEMDDYVHRIGRTGRAGNKGIATCFYNRNNRKICLEMYKYLREHDQEIPNWFREEAEMMEGDAMLSREIGMNRRRGGGGGEGGGRHNETTHTRNPDEKWGSSTAASGRGHGHGKAASGAGNMGAGRRSNLTTDIDDGGF